MRAVVVSCALLVASLAGAQPAPDAKALIKQGKALLKQKKIAEACEQFAQAEDATPSYATEMLLADCREKEGKPATAYELFGIAADSATAAKNKRGVLDAKKRSKKLEPKLLYLTVEVPPERRVFQLEVERDGVAIPEDRFGAKLPVDPGTYTLTAKAPGRISWTTSVTVDQTAKDQTVEMPALVELPLPPPPKPKPVATSHGKRRFKGATIGLSVAGVGGLGIGIVLGLHAKSLAADADAICPHAACLDPGALDLNKRARSSATYANVALIGGSAALVGAAVLWWIGRPTVRPVVERQQVGLVVEGAW